ncbi:MAG: thioredoxin family protein [Acidobacteria bacterium]|nr:thioredoxin family protein [Acidobacteriota bacterium]
MQIIERQLGHSEVRIVLNCAALVLLMAFFPAPLGAQESEIRWFKNLAEASAVAQKTNQPMLIDFWADWCAPCKIMDAEVYQAPELVSVFGSKMIGVRIHFDLQPEVVRKYNVPALPYLVFTDSLGTELMHHRGLIETDDLTAVVRAFPADVSELNRVGRILREDKNHFASLREMGQKLRALGFFESSNGFYERAVKQNEAKKDVGQREAVLYEMALNSLELQDGKTAAANLERCLKDNPKSARRPELLLNLGRAYALDEKKNKARKPLNSVIAEFPASPAAAHARALLQSL